MTTAMATMVWIRLPTTYPVSTKTRTIAVIRNSNGDTWVGVANGDPAAQAANRNIAVDFAHATDGARCAVRRTL